MTDRASLRVMVLEDEPLIAMSTEQALEDLGYRDIDVFYRLDPAVTAAGAAGYDVAVLDVNVDRNRTSLDLAHALKGSGTAILFASGNSIDDDKLRAITDAVLSKPYTDRDLDEALGQLLAARST